MKDLTGECRFWHNFVNSNILPSSNLTYVNTERAALLYILTGEEPLNIAAVLSDRICSMVRGSRKKELLGFVSLINRLCIRAGVSIPEDEDLYVLPASEMTHTTYVDHCSKAENEFRKRANNFGVGRPPSPRVPRVPLPLQEPEPTVPPPPIFPPPPAVPTFPAGLAGSSGFAATAAPQGFPSGIDFYGLQQQLARLSVQNEVIISNQEYHSRFLEHAYPNVPFSTFQPVHPEIPPPYVYQQPFPAPPPAQSTMPPRSFWRPVIRPAGLRPGPHRPPASCPFPPRAGVMVAPNDDSDEDHADEDA